MAKLANTPTDKDVYAFIEAVKNEKRRQDALQLVKIIKEITGREPVIWGVSIIGFGHYTYKRKNGKEFEWFNVGFSPAAAHLTVYVMYDINSELELLKQLGEHSCGKGCLYIKSLERVNQEVLKEIIRKSDRWERGK